LGLGEVNKIRQRAIGILCACFILLTVGYLEAAWIDYYFYPSIHASGDMVYLIYKRNPKIGGVPSSYLHFSEDGENWPEPVYLPFDTGVSQVMGESLFAVRNKDYSIFDLKSIRKSKKIEWKESGEFGLDWGVSLALAEEDGLRLLGFKESQAVEKKKILLQEAVMVKRDIIQILEKLEFVSPEKIAACIQAQTLWLIYKQEGESLIHVVRREKDKNWEEFKTIDIPFVLYDCAWCDNKLHIVGALDNLKTGGKGRLAHVYISPDGSQSRIVEWNHGIRNYLGALRPVHEVSIASKDEKLFLAVRLNNVIATSIWHNDKWNNFKVVNRIPTATLIVMWIWQLGILALCASLVWTGYQLFLAKKGRLTKSIQQEPVEYKPAGHFKRFAAFIIDFTRISHMV